MKAAILGTTDYHATMQQIAQDALQRTNTQVAEMPLIMPVRENFSIYADDMVRSIARDDTIRNCNPRTPYLFLAWMLLGSNNPYKIYQYLCSEDAMKHRQVVILALRIALGDSVPERYITTIYQAVQGITLMSYTGIAGEQARQAAKISKMVVGAIGYLARNTLPIHADTAAKHVVDTAACDVVQNNAYAVMVLRKFNEQMQQWAYISDEEAGLIARQLLFDILDAGK